MASKIKKFSVKEAIAMASKIQKKASLSWYDKLNSDKKAWCDQLKKEYESGSCDHISTNSLRAVVNENLSIQVGEQSFRTWIKSIKRAKRAH